MATPAQKILSLFGLQPGEKGVVLCDTQDLADEDQRDRLELATNILNELLDGAFQAELLNYDMRKRHNEPLPKFGRSQQLAEVELSAELSTADVVVAVTKWSATAPLAEAIRHQPRIRAISMPGFRRRSLTGALRASQSEIAILTARYKKVLDEANVAEVEFSTGHRAVFDLTGQVAHVDDGDVTRPGKLINCPFGETYSITRDGPNSLTSGKVPIPCGDGLAVLTLRTNRIVHVEGKGPDFEALRDFYAKDPARTNIAEFGLGANRWAQVIPGDRYILEEEKALGFHWAFGRNDQFGGNVGPDQFLSPENVVHEDIVYNADTPVGITSLVLHFDNGRSEEIFRANQLVMPERVENF